jgi:superfamily II DNA or RNA helicase
MDVSLDYTRGKCIIRCDIDFFKRLREYISVPNTVSKFQSRFAPRRLYAITPTGQFETGMVPDVIAAIKDIDNTASISLSDSIKSILSSEYSDDLHPLDCNLKLHYYQEEIIKRSLKNGRGVCVLGTGGGKTLTIATLIVSAYKQHASCYGEFKCLVVVPDIGLVQQTYDDFKSYNVPLNTSRWSGEYEVDRSANIVIANSSILINRFESEKWLLNVDMVVVDECHKLRRGNSISNLIGKIKTNSKFGFTGTLPESVPDQWSVKGKIGPVFFIKDSNELREEGFLSSVTTKVLKLSYKDKPQRVVNTPTDKSARFRAELDFLYMNSFRNNLLKTICGNFNNNILILVNHLLHGEELLKILSEISNRRVVFVQGSVKTHARLEIKEAMESNSNVICIAMTSIFSTGINIKNIHMVIFASGGKAFVRMVQSIGRGLRLHETKSQLLILDLADDLHYGNLHINKRLSIYEAEKIPYSITSINQ